MNETHMPCKQLERLISSTADFKIKSVTRKKEELFVIIKGSVDWEDIITICKYSKNSFKMYKAKSERIRVIDKYKNQRWRI